MNVGPTNPSRFSLTDQTATLGVVARHSALGSRLVVLYHCPGFMRYVVGPVVRWLGEPLRSSFNPGAMAALLAKHGFEAVRDQGLPEIGAAMADATKVVKHLRIVTATRVAPADRRS